MSVAHENSLVPSQDALRLGRHNFAPIILREYDIRGTVGQTLDGADARALGRAFGEMVLGHGTRIAVGRDGRHSSPMLEAALIEGLRDAGAEVERIGIGPTPMLHFAVHCLSTTAGIMVTGSHNPPAQNGFKMVLGSRPVFGEAVRELGRAAARGFPPGGRRNRKGCSRV